MYQCSHISNCLLLSSLVVSFLFCSQANCFALSDTPTQPNIILILADDLGYGDIGCFGQKTIKTPHLDTMAQEGMRFTQFYAGSTICGPSRCVLLTGQHTGRSVIRGNVTDPIIIQRQQTTVASILKNAGYATACIGKWGVGTPDNFSNPNDVGFDHFFGYVNMWHAHNFYPEFLIRNGEVERLRNIVDGEWQQWRDPKNPRGGMGFSKKRVQYAPDLFIDEALQFVREHDEGPFFLFLSLNAPHANSEAGNKGMEVPMYGEFASQDWPDSEKGFAAMIQAIDRDAGRILDLLRELRLDRQTLVLFTSDNGPHEAGGHDPDFFDSNGELRGIKRDLYEGGIRVPMIAWWPGVVEPGSETKHVSYIGDFLTTASDLSGVKAPEGLQSNSLVPVLTGHSNRQRKHDYLYWEYYERGGMQAVRFGDYKAIRQPMHDGQVELYDLSQDSSETYNLAELHPELTKRATNYMNEAHRPDSNWKVRPMRAK